MLNFRIGKWCLEIKIILIILKIYRKFFFFEKLNLSILFVFCSYINSVNIIIIKQKCQNNYLGTIWLISYPFTQTISLLRWPIDFILVKALYMIIILKNRYMHIENVSSIVGLCFSHQNSLSYKKYIIIYRTFLNMIPAWCLIKKILLKISILIELRMLFYNIFIEQLKNEN
jgi:hypothetical protein